jgi:hypothetical protein
MGLLAGARLLLAEARAVAGGAGLLPARALGTLKAVEAVG